MLIDIPFWRIPSYYLDEYLDESVDTMRARISKKEAEVVISQVAYPQEEFIPGMNSKAHLIGIILKMQEPQMYKLYSSLKEDNVFLIKQILQEKDTNKIGILLGAAKCNSLKITQLLIRNFINVDETDDLGWTALATAIVYGNEAVFNELIKNGADINNHTLQGVTPLMLAATKANIVMVKVLLKNKADIHAADRYGNTALKYAEDINSVEIITILKEAGLTESAIS